MEYRTLSQMALAFCLTSWLIVTGLSIEKVIADGVQSWTMLLAMPVFVAAVAFLCHQAVEDFREWRFFRSSIGFSLALMTLAVTLPNSIGTSGSAKDTAVAEAQASNRGLAFSEKMLAEAEKDLADAKAGAKQECVGAPEHFEGMEWPKCRDYRRQVAAHTLAVEKYAKGVASAPVEKKPLSGETRLAWALSGIGGKLPEAYSFTVSETSVQMAQPMFPPIAGEFLCAFFGFMHLEFRRLAKREKENEEKAPAAEPAAEAQVEIAAAPAVAVEAQPEQLLIEEEVTDPTPPDGGQKQTKRQRKKKAKMFDFGREYKARHGHWPTHGQIAGRFHLTGATASRWRQEMIKAAA